MKVSIIIPVYEVSAYIERCLQSVLNQTYTDIECVIVDDATPDDSIVKCERMISAYQGPIRFCILHHERNRGLSAARNTGAAAATGEFLYYLDSDDEITPDCIEKLMGCVAAHPDVEMVQGVVYRHFLRGKENKYPKSIETSYVGTNDLVRDCFYKTEQIDIVVWNKLLRRSFIEENGLFCREGLLHEDVLWSFYLLKHLSCVAFCPDVTYHFWQRPHSITTGNGVQLRMKSLAKIYREVLESLTPGHEREEYNFYAIRISREYVRYGGIVPEYRQVFKLYIKECSRLGDGSLYLRLILCSILGRLRVWTVLVQIKHYFHHSIFRS